MAAHHHTGRNGEELAREYFEQRGFFIQAQNWRYSYYEVDLIASHKNVLHFIEVKTRKKSDFGYPEDSVTKKKLNNLKQAAREYLYQHPEWKLIQFDILSIILGKEGNEFFLIEDVF